MGTINPGDPVPSLREAEAALGVSLHTVRKAYRLLEGEGLLEIRDRRRARVRRPGAGSAMADDIESFARWAVELARDRFGLAPAELAERIRGYDPSLPAPVVWVVECSVWLAALLADQVREHCGADARPCLVTDLSPQAGEWVVSTFYHVREIEARNAGADVVAEFLPVELDPDYLDELRASLDPDSPRLVICGVESETVGAIAQDLVAALGPLRLELIVSSAPGEIVSRADPAVPIVVTPENWDVLSEEQRSLRNVFAHRSRFTAGALRDLATPLRRVSPQCRNGDVGDVVRVDALVGSAPTSPTGHAQRQAESPRCGRSRSSPRVSVGSP